jgi:predicted alpha/beta superfamily hydrolase
VAIRRIAATLAATAVIGLAACAGPAEPLPGPASPSAMPPDWAPPAVSIPEQLATIPQAYYTPAEQAGTLVEFGYDTWEAMSYQDKTQPLTKRAIVYLPPGYREDQDYDVFYLMHGGWGNESATLGTPAAPSPFKNVLDHAIGAGEITPLIVVCPTYNNTSPEDSASFGLALDLNERYHHELLNDLIPAIEAAYPTHAASTSPEDLIASRDHRGFGGFSMGAVATWRTFQHALDYFYYFLPMSCGTTLDDDAILAAADTRADFFLWIITGTEDFAYGYDQDRAERLRETPGFTEAGGNASGNFAYRVKEGYAHDGLAASEYTYNGLRAFWRGTQP